MGRTLASLMMIIKNYFQLFSRPDELDRDSARQFVLLHVGLAVHHAAAELDVRASLPLVAQVRKIAAGGAPTGSELDRGEEGAYSVHVTAPPMYFSNSARKVSRLTLMYA